MNVIKWEADLFHASHSILSSKNLGEPRFRVHQSA
jgi:hypothetical protein